ncbi:hypothetical protein ACFIJ5_08400 [Haloimpatiens sp. FM7330]|uniref:hypothetical protein n=1 Tax=Haloimpatiens sp. FM7330 TaxID=3298610 RepID=UPI003626233F
MHYIWINPVVEKMYKNDLDNLKNNLTEKGFIIVSTNGQIQKVKNKFKNIILNSEKPVLDTRCPMAVDYVNKNIDTSKYNIPKIEPILIHTARDLYNSHVKDLEKDDLIITTPCKALKQLGKDIFKNKQGIEFYTWLEFCSIFGIPTASKCNLSPIPLGFFRDISENILEISGENKFNECFSQDSYDIIEMLYCSGGCNNGDGV